MRGQEVRKMCSVELGTQTRSPGRLSMEPHAVGTLSQNAETPFSCHPQIQLVLQGALHTQLRPSQPERPTSIHSSLPQRASLWSPLRVIRMLHLCIALEFALGGGIWGSRPQSSGSRLMAHGQGIVGSCIDLGHELEGRSEILVGTSSWPPKLLREQKQR